MDIRTSRALLSLAIFLTPMAFAQSDCSNPIQASPSGATLVDWSIETLSTYPAELECHATSSSQRDAFIHWTAPADGVYHFYSNLSAAISLRLQEGLGCEAPCLWLAGSGWGPSSWIFKDAKAGETLQFRMVVNTYSGVSTFHADAIADACNVPAYILNDATSCSGAPNISDGHYQAAKVSVTEPEFYRLSLYPGATVKCSAHFSHSQGDVNLYLRHLTTPPCPTGGGPNVLAEGTSATDDEEIVWTNNTGTQAHLVLEISLASSNPPNTCNIYDLKVGGAGFLGGRGQRFCDPMDVNSERTPTLLAAVTHPSLPTVLQLRGYQGPENQFGYFLVGTGSQAPGLPISNGRLCLEPGPAGMIGRYNIAGTPFNSVCQFNALGNFVNATGNPTPIYGFVIPIDLPFAGSPLIQPGQTLHFQIWHRDVLGSSNFSNGLSLTF